MHSKGDRLYVHLLHLNPAKSKLMVLSRKGLSSTNDHTLRFYIWDKVNTTCVILTWGAAVVLESKVCTFPPSTHIHIPTPWQPSSVDSVWSLSQVVRWARSVSLKDYFHALHLWRWGVCHIPRGETQHIFWRGIPATSGRLSVHAMLPCVFVPGWVVMLLLSVSFLTGAGLGEKGVLLSKFQVQRFTPQLYFIIM